MLTPGAPGSLEALERELGAVAALDHPNVVRLLDHGVVDRTAAALLRGLVVGSPWIAMELAEDGTLEPLLGRVPWSVARGLLVSILDALAHAHARGLLHLDVKPANVLLAGGQVKIADFGLATAAGSGLARVAGTPDYMAPEQFRGREVGPWTDLYAVGCVAVALTSGAPPFPLSAVDGVREAHLQAQPTIAPSVPVPHDFAAWVRRLLVKHPPERFRRAADAARSLVALGSTPDAPGLARTIVQAAPTVVLPTGDDGGPAPLDVVGDRAPVPRPEVPATWTRPCALPPPALTDAGLALFGLRAPPFVGRVRERTHLWDTLARAARERRAEGVVILAHAGYGASSLAAWLCERAHEVGAASPLAVRGEGMAAERALALHLGCGGLGGTERVELLVRLFPEASRGEVQLLGEILEQPATLGPRDRMRILVRAIASEARRRPVVLWLDDPDEDLLLLAEATLAVAEPVLVVITGRPDGAADAWRRGRCSTVTLGSLPTEEHRALLASLLPLSPEALARIAATTDGHPRFAVQLMTDLVRGDQLVAGADGWSLRTGAVLPDSLEASWAARLADVMLPLGPDAAAALRVAALLEPVVEDDVWALACSHVGVRAAPEVGRALVDARLARRGEAGWVFEDAALRAAALGPSDPTALHAACAEALTRVGRAPAEAARHWLGAGQPDRAAEALRAAASDATADGRLHLALAHCDALEAVASGLEGPVSARAELDAERMRAQVEGSRRALGDAARRLVSARDRAQALGLGPEEERIRVELATIWRQSSRADLALPVLEPLSRSENPRVRVLALLELGRIDRDERRFDLALERFAAAVEAARDDDEVTRARADAALGSALSRVGRPEEGLALLERARATLRRRCQRRNEALLAIDVASALRALGRTLEADAELDLAEQTLEALGSWAAELAACRRAVLLWAAGRDAEGDAVATRVEPRTVLGAVVGLVLAAHRDEPDWDDRLEQALAARAQHDAILSEALALAAGRSARAGLAERALALGRLSREVADRRG